MYNNSIVVYEEVSTIKRSKHSERLRCEEMQKDRLSHRIIIKCHRDIEENCTPALCRTGVGMEIVFNSRRNALLWSPETPFEARYVG